MKVVISSEEKSSMIPLDYIASLVSRANATILEIGANDGTDTRRLAQLFPYGDIIAFEPDPRAAQRFKDRTDSARIHLFELAIGAKIGKTIFHQSGGQWPYGEEQRLLQGIPSEWDQSGSIRAPKLHVEVYPWVKFENDIEVPITTLDNWADENRIKLIDFIWADVQGAEIDLIKGGQSVLRSTRYLYTEFSKVELYEGAPGVEEISSMLPDFDLLEVFEHDALFANKKLLNLFD